MWPNFLPKVGMSCSKLNAFGISAVEQDSLCWEQGALPDLLDKNKAFCILSYCTIFPYLVFQIITLSDLECDYINARSCCSKLNKVNYSSLRSIWFKKTIVHLSITDNRVIMYISRALIGNTLHVSFISVCLSFLDAHLSANWVMKGRSSDAWCSEKGCCSEFMGLRLNSAESSWVLCFRFCRCATPRMSAHDWTLRSL